MQRLVRGKKGDVTDIITFLIVVFFIMTSMLIAAFVNDNLSDVISGSALNDTQVAQDALEQIDNITTHSVQNGSVMIVTFLMIGMMLSAFMVRIHPIFLFLYIIFLASALFTAVPLANSYQMLMESNAIASVASQQTMMTWVMEHLVTVVLGAGLLGMLVTFAKLKGQGGDL